jgi:Flp pilus assembly protein TadD
MVAPSPPAAATSTLANANANPDAPGTSARQLQAGREALAQAQNLWNAGSHDTAVELLQQALALAERSANAAPTAPNTQLLATLAREQARMQIADGRPQAALEGLTRLEPLLGREAEAWAMRGNAAQRLGRHQDSVHAYTTALQLRPNEQRWLLGAAVSLAALGQTANAAEMATKARAQGPISKEVQAYLRQAGVLLNEP